MLGSMVGREEEGKKKGKRFIQKFPEEDTTTTQGLKLPDELKNSKVLRLQVCSGESEDGDGDGDGDERRVNASRTRRASYMDVEIQDPRMVSKDGDDDDARWDASTPPPACNLAQPYENAMGRDRGWLFTTGGDLRGDGAMEAFQMGSMARCGGV
ncbi:hypothetical protein G7046_g9640 [Stylonectria norvegica]|nr:hypothetical protein G7046_g9640 [Stylonectria norvegica]